MVASCDAWVDTEDAIETADATATVVVLCAGVETSSRGASGVGDKAALEAGIRVARIVMKRNTLKTTCVGGGNKRRGRYAEKL